MNASLLQLQAAEPVQMSVPTTAQANAKSQAKEVADKMWKPSAGSADVLRYTVEQVGSQQQQTLRYVATVEVVPTGNTFTGSPCTNKKAAEQSAAAAALPFLQGLRPP